MSRELRICPGVGDRKCGAFLSTLDRDPYPTCARCRGKICTKDMTCDFCADWSAAQWECFTKKRSYKERKKSRPSGSVPPASQTSPRAETSSGVSRPRTSSSSSEFMKAQNCCIPQRKITPNGTKQPECFNKSIAEAISNRQKAYNISKLRPSPETKVAHIKECRNVDKLIRRAKLNEEDRVAAAAKDNPKAFFAHVNSRKPVKNTIGPLKDRTGSIISSDEGMANILNEYFTSGFTEEDTSEIPIVPIVYRGNNPLRKIEITVDKVKMKLKKLNSNKSAGPDGFYPRVIKEMEEETAPHFCNIFRTSLEQRKAVRDWKLKNISPLFKKGPKDDPGNYRPISLTSVPGKMLESIIADDMMSHLEHNKLILDSQHGFRSGRSCLTNLVDFFHDMFSIYDKSRAVDILYLDF